MKTLLTLLLPLVLIGCATDGCKLVIDNVDADYNIVADGTFNTARAVITGAGCDGSITVKNAETTIKYNANGLCEGADDE